MAQQVILEVSPRTVMGKATRHLRKRGIVPANIYGHKQSSTPIQLDAMTFDRLRRGHGTRNIITLRFANAPTQTALVKHVQRDAITDRVLHIDFTRVDVRERIEVNAPLNYVGDAPGIKIQGGVFLRLVDSVTVECEAGEIVESLEADISSLNDLDAVLHAGDVKLPTNYVLITDPKEPIAKIEPPRVEVVGVPAPAAEEAVASRSGTTAPAAAADENE
jgi:large subunit ribosomal protein L25